MPIKVDILDSGTHLERSAAKNYANPRYKCADISDMDPIGDQNHNQGNPQFRSHPNPLNRYSRTLVREDIIMFVFVFLTVPVKSIFAT